MNTFKKTLTLAVATLSMAATGLWAHSDAFKPEFVDTLVAPYLQIQSGLAGDDLIAAKSGANAYLAAMESAPEGEATEESSDLRAPAEKIAQAEDIKVARAAFLELSNEMTSLVKHVGTTGHTPLFVAHCPMAFGGKGGDWIQSDKNVLNPYYGSMMLHCGGIKEQVAGEEGSGHMMEGGEHMEHGHGGMEHGHGMDHHADGAYSPTHLDAVHAGVPAYFAQASASASSAAESKDSDGCGMACCAQTN